MVCTRTSLGVSFLGCRMNEIKLIKTVGDLKKALALYPDNAKVCISLGLGWGHITGTISEVEGRKPGAKCEEGYFLDLATHDAQTVYIQHEVVIADELEEDPSIPIDSIDRYFMEQAQK